jgi:hypothetical protein
MISVERPTMRALTGFKGDEFSQFGEDGIVREILTRLSEAGDQELDQWCVEFGAWDGIRGSNTYNLIKSAGYRSVLIEPDKSKFRELLTNIPDPIHIKLNTFVTLSSENSLDSLLQGTEIPREFDFLSIDIDGMDFYIWESFVEYKPKLVCIEFNPTIPLHLSFIQPKDFSINQGSSARAISDLAIRKGYSLVAATECNLFFVNSKYQDCVLGAKRDTQLEEVVNSPYPEVYVFSGYDGTVHLSEKLILPWHGLEIEKTSLQFLPQRIRTYLPDYTKSQRLNFLFYRIRKKGIVWGTRQVIQIVKRNFVVKKK